MITIIQMINWTNYLRRSQICMWVGRSILPSLPPPRTQKRGLVIHRRIEQRIAAITFN
ncbi:hypothetical protein C8Q75DRAFT_751040 [Abortiporus biennis]|nr:hypothetical protein C8Q75DRAFT_751040 [Abortiporus biennis]